MPHNTSINMDARWLWTFTETMVKSNLISNEEQARLLLIADHIDALEEKTNNAYGRGYQDGQKSLQSRSNLSTSRPVSSNLYEALQSYKGTVTKGAPPKELKKTVHLPTLTLDDLDLDLDLEDL